MNGLEEMKRSENLAVTNPASNVRSSLPLRIAAWIAALTFVLGWFTPVVGAFTGTILGAWFVRTQKVLRGFLWMMAFSLFFSLLREWRLNPLADPLGAGPER